MAASHTKTTAMRAALAPALLLAVQPALAQLPPSEENPAGTAPELAYSFSFGENASPPPPQAGAPAEPAMAAPPAKDEEPEHGTLLQYALLDRLEWSPRGDSYAWDFSALLGGDTNRLYFGTSGEGAFAGKLDYAELDTFYSRNLGGDWDINAGLRYDLLPHPSRFHAALGAQYDDDKLWFGTWAYLSDKGELSARLAAYYNLKLTKRLFLQPSVELDAYGQDVPALGVGRGLSYAEAGLRMRYEMLDHLAPYVGFSWSRDLGRTARLDRAAGEDPETRSVVMGLRSEF
jgi:copper resistance protein B